MKIVWHRQGDQIGWCSCLDECLVLVEGQCIPVVEQEPPAIAVGYHHLVMAATETALLLRKPVNSVHPATVRHHQEWQPFYQLSQVWGHYIISEVESSHTHAPLKARSPMLCLSRMKSLRKHSTMQLQIVSHSQNLRQLVISSSMMAMTLLSGSSIALM